MSFSFNLNPMTMMSTTIEKESNIDQCQVDHFLRCYRSGGHGAASSGEQAAYKLGQALLKHIGAPSDLDYDCLQGFVALINVAHTGYDGMDVVKRMLGGRRAQ